MSIILFGLLGIFILLNASIGFSALLAATVALLYKGTIPLVLIPQRMFNGTDSWPLLAIPLFIFAGTLMERGGISTRLVNLANVLVGWARGGLGMAVVVATIFFSDISGSSSADTAAIGSVTIPPMIRRGYARAFATGIVAAAGGMGLLIPPCITMIIYGSVAEVSIAALFAAAFVPGFIMALFIMAGIYITAIRKNLLTDSARPSLSTLRATTREAALPMLAPVIVLGGIIGGVFTPTEAASVAVIFGLIVSIFVYKDLKFADLWQILNETVVATGVIVILIAGANILGWLMAVEQLPGEVARFFATLEGARLAFLLAVNVLFLISGCILDPIASVVLWVPMLLPSVEQVGVDPIHFGIVVIANLAVGLVTPPMAPCLFIACAIAKVPMREVFRPLIPLLGLMILSLVVVNLVPDLTLFLPRLLLGYKG
jgi:C4-dicarboxylate transporter DctM subunit